MAYLKVSLGNAIVAALVFVLYVTRMTSAVYSLADVAHAGRFELAIRSTNAEWYSDGMQLFAYKCTKRRWDKRTLIWGIMQYPKKGTRKFFDDVVKAAFEKWARVIPFVFAKVTPNPQLILFTQQPDIRILFAPLPPDSLSLTSFPAGEGSFDTGGIDILINDSINWDDEDDLDWYDLRFTALYQIGRALGLAGSNKSSSIMYSESSKRSYSGVDPVLDQDDIDGAQYMYGPPRKVLSGPV